VSTSATRSWKKSWRRNWSRSRRAGDPGPPERRRLRSRRAHDIEALWDQLRRGDRIEARPRLIIYYAALVTDAADEIKERLTAAQRSDLVSYGIFGLVDALDEFDPGQGWTFERFATERIREAILRELLAP
jgi:RNA polymerase sigma factor for flagellar operon FliA